MPLKSARQRIATKVNKATLQEIFNCKSISPYSVRIPENADQNNSGYGHFSRGECERMNHQTTQLRRIAYC